MAPSSPAVSDVTLVDVPVTAESAVTPAVPPPPAPGSPPGASRTIGARLRRIGPPAALALVVLALWTFASDHLLHADKRFLLPSPLDVLRIGLLDGRNRAEVLHGVWSTGKVALVGIGVSMVLGVALAVAMSQARWIEDSVYPYAVVLQTIPILAVVPLVGYWFGFEFRSRVLVCVMIGIFPIITNTLFGLKSVDPSLHDLFTLHHAGRLTRLRKLQLPAALPAMFEGFRISAGLSVIGSIVADFFFRQGDPGVGRLIDVYRQRLATEQLMTAVLLSSLLGLVVFWTFGWVASRALRSRRPRGSAVKTSP
ncbi:MAG: NitT/TauT family transport system permease protein [Actinomycetota bacterium]|jgi:NitT/TauT family transport system permease protein|nr:NitT/TauT family transport system permease protein [Actinomycetota bacterium]